MTQEEFDSLQTGQIIAHLDLDCITVTGIYKIERKTKTFVYFQIPGKVNVKKVSNPRRLALVK
jgi:hypothetical protein